MRKIFENIKLKNGLNLQMFYRSKTMAGDRCQVIFKVKIDVDIRPEVFSDKMSSDIAFQNVQNLLGNRTYFHYLKERNFVSENEKEEILETMKQDFIAANFRYLSSPDFPARLIKRNYLKELESYQIKQRRLMV